MRASTGVFAGGDVRVDLPFEPDAVMLWWTSQAGHGVEGGNRGGIGFWAQGEARAAAWASDDQAAPTRTVRSVDEVAVLAIGTAGERLSGRIVSTEGGGLTLAWEGEGALRVHYLALGELADARVGWLADDVETGFAPDLVLVAPISGDAVGLTTRGLVAAFGAAAEGGQIGAAYVSNDAVSTAEVGGAQHAGTAVVAVAAGRRFEALGRLELGAHGFSVGWEPPPETPRLDPFLAVRGLRCSVGTTLSPRKPGRGRRRGLGFRPEALVAFSVGLTPRSEPAPIGRLCVGAAVSGGEGCAGWDDRNVGEEPTMTHMCSTADRIVVVTDTRTGLPHAAATLRSFDRRGFTLDWVASDVADREVAFVALASL